MKIILLRHGLTEANERRLYCGATDIPLTDAGIKSLAELKAGGVYPKADNLRVITSGMKRCDMTLEILFGDVSREVDPRYREMDFGAFEMRSYEQMKDDPDYIAWISGDNEKNIPPRGESGAAMKARVFAAWDELISDQSDMAGEAGIMIITHGGPIAAIMERLFPQEDKNRYQWQPRPGRGYIVTLAKDKYLPI